MSHEGLEWQGKPRCVECYAELAHGEIASQDVKARVSHRPDGFGIVSNDEINASQSELA